MRIDPTRGKRIYLEASGKKKSDSAKVAAVQGIIPLH